MRETAKYDKDTEWGGDDRVSVRLPAPVRTVYGRAERTPPARARPPDRASSRPGERRSSCWGSSDDARARELGATRSTRSGPIPTLPASDAVVQFSERRGERSENRGARIHMHGWLSCPCT